MKLNVIVVVVDLTELFGLCFTFLASSKNRDLAM